MNERTEVLVVGRSCLDTIASVDVFPKENRKGPLEFRMTEGGGQGGTASCCIARLGGKAVYVGRLGDDAEGRFCLQRLADFGVDATFVSIVPGGSTPVAYIFVTRPTGKRTIIYERNSLPRLGIEDIRPALARKPKVLLLDPETTYLAETIGSLTGAGVKIVYDCERWRTGMEAMMATADFFIPSSEFLNSERLGFEALAFTEKLARLKALIKGELIVTRGEKGAFYFADDHLYHVPAPQITVKDTTGAGDDFHAAFALAVSQGQDIHNAVRFSVAVASLSCRDYGGRKGIPGKDEALGMAGSLETRQL